MKTTIKCESSKHDDYKRCIESRHYKLIMKSLTNIIASANPTIIYNLETSEITYKYNETTERMIEECQKTLNDLLAGYIN